MYLFYQDITQKLDIQKKVCYTIINKYQNNKHKRCVMTKKEKLCLEMRNKTSKENEIFCEHYNKKFGGYLFHLIFGFESMGTLIVGLGLTLMGVFLFDSSTDLVARILFFVGAGFTDLLFFYFIIKGLWYWKFTKHIFVTNEGIWVMTCSSFWWRGAPDFMGKRRFWAPSWSLYTWSELKNVTDDKKAIPKDTSKISNAFDSIDNFVKGIFGLKTVYMTRFDGTERIDFLTKLDCEEILNHYKTNKKSKRKKKKQKSEKVEIEKNEKVIEKFEFEKNTNEKFELEEEKVQNFKFDEKTNDNTDDKIIED